MQKYVPVTEAKVRLYKGITLTAPNLLETMTADNEFGEDNFRLGGPTPNP
jgi:hypothetical protein